MTLIWKNGSFFVVIREKYAPKFAFFGVFRDIPLKWITNISKIENNGHKIGEEYGYTCHLSWKYIENGRKRWKLIFFTRMWNIWRVLEIFENWLAYHKNWWGKIGKTKSKNGKGNEMNLSNRPKEKLREMPHRKMRSRVKKKLGIFSLCRWQGLSIF